MLETFGQYLEKWLKQSTAQGLSNPLVKMPVKRFRPLDTTEFTSINSGKVLTLGTTSDPIVRHLFKNFQTRIRERGEHSAHVCAGSVAMTVSAGAQNKSALFPICLRKISLFTSGEMIKAQIDEDDRWEINPVLRENLKTLGIIIPDGYTETPTEVTAWIRTQLSNRAQSVNTDYYVGLFSSQQMVVQSRLNEFSIRQSLARNPVICAKLSGTKVASEDLGEITDEGIEDLGLTLPCDDSQLRVIQLADKGFNLQVEGPPGTGKSQTIANIVGNALWKCKSVLVVCDKKAAILQVEERLSDIGLAPALINLHDEDLDKRDFLKQATSKFTNGKSIIERPLEQLRDDRKLLNERVRFGRNVAHASFPISKIDALSGLIKLRSELRDVPSINIPSWNSLSKDRLKRILGSLAEWPDLKVIVSNEISIWNKVKIERFNGKPNALNELQLLCSRFSAYNARIEALEELLSTVGVDIPLNSIHSAINISVLAKSVINKPKCHLSILGAKEYNITELNKLKDIWLKCKDIEEKNYPISLSKKVLPAILESVDNLSRLENAVSWQQFLNSIIFHDQRINRLKEHQSKYKLIVEQLGLIYSPSLKVRRSQIYSLVALGQLGVSIPRDWWDSKSSPLIAIANWKAQLQACAAHAKRSPLPLHFVSLERISKTHWHFIEAKAEHGFNAISYCLNFVNDRKCKYALKQVFPDIPQRRFESWQEVTLHAVSALHSMRDLQQSAQVHNVLKQLTQGYLGISHENPSASTFLEHRDISLLDKAASCVEQMRPRRDLFEIEASHWLTFWEAVNPTMIARAEEYLRAIDSLEMPLEETDNVESAIEAHCNRRDALAAFISQTHLLSGDDETSVVESFNAQKQYCEYQASLNLLAKYLALQDHPSEQPNWEKLEQWVTWRDAFESLRGIQKLDIDSKFWSIIDSDLDCFYKEVSKDKNELLEFFEIPDESIDLFSEIQSIIEGIQSQIHLSAAWIEKKKWHFRVTLLPELRSLWESVIAGKVDPNVAQKLFCFNLLHLSDPFASPSGVELRQALKTFSEQDEKLSVWVVEHIKEILRRNMQDAARSEPSSESELFRLSGLQRIRGTVRELVNANIRYLLAAKKCWMMSPTSLANLIDVSTLEKGPLFDLVIFDEASQLRVLDGLLSMAFAKQVIIVGDKNQLPPTDFFSGFGSIDDESEQSDFGVSESLLDEFSGVFEE
jgi:hypothetical protein